MAGKSKTHRAYSSLDNCQAEHIFDPDWRSQADMKVGSEGFGEC